jgi:hypothetical protein
MNQPLGVDSPHGCEPKNHVPHRRIIDSATTLADEGQADGISTAKLRSLLTVHVRPIKLVVCQRPYPLTRSEGSSCGRLRA